MGVQSHVAGRLSHRSLRWTVLALLLVATFAPGFAGPRLANRMIQPGTADALLGCWRYSSGPVIRVRSDGSVTFGQITGKWRLADAAKQAYVLNWPEIQDNAVVSEDNKTLTETSAWFTLTATRMSGGSGIVGMWQWPGGALILTVRADKTFSAGPINGGWQPAEVGERTFTLTWPGPIHTGVLAPDGQKFSGADQYGNQFAAAKEPCGER